MLDEEDHQKLEEIAFVLTDRSKPTLVCISVGSYRKRDELRVELDRLVPDCPSGLLNISGQPITSLFRTIREQAPVEALSAAPGKYLLHVYGIEDSLLIFRDGKVAASSLLEELNMERENLFHQFPCCLIIWTTPHFINKLRTEAPDLWDWITHNYHFPDPCCETADSEVPEYAPMPRGVTAERKKRISELEARLQSLQLGDHAPDRVVRSAISLHKALGGEYLAAFRHAEAIRSYRAALALLQQVNHTEDEKAELFFQLGTVYISARYFDNALESYEESLRLQSEASVNAGSTWHQIGMVYEEQRNWPQALECYQKALEWNEKAGQQHDLGSTWHHIGRVYEEQRNWPQALESYQKALELYETTGQLHQVGGTWHQIGMVYEEQRNWPQALESYQKALEWKEKTGQQHEIGGTWHQIGMVYEEQRNWPQALESYQKALEWKEKTGQQHELGGTWHQIGRVKEEQGAVSEALDCYLAAYRLVPEWRQEIVINSLRRIFPALAGNEKRRLKDNVPEELYDDLEGHQD